MLQPETHPHNRHCVFFNYSSFAHSSPLARYDLYLCYCRPASKANQQFSDGFPSRLHMVLAHFYTIEIILQRFETCFRLVKSDQIRFVPLAYVVLALIHIWSLAIVCGTSQPGKNKHKQLQQRWRSVLGWGCCKFVRYVEKLPSKQSWEGSYHNPAVQDIS